MLESGSQSRSLGDNPFVVTVAVLAGLVAIFTFLTGVENLPSALPWARTPTPTSTAMPGIGFVSAPTATVTPPRGYLYFRNNCARPVRLAVGYQDQAQNWQYVKWWDFAANSQSFLQQGSVQLSSDNAYFYYYAETTDGSGITWQGDRPFDFGGESLPTQEVVLTPDSDGDWVLSVSCKTPPRGYLYFRNDCARPVRLAVRYMDTAQNWQHVKWWSFAANGRSLLLQDNVQLTSAHATFYYYAETTDGSGITWQGDQTFDFGGESLATREVVLTPDSDGDWALSVACEPPRGHLYFYNNCFRPVRLAVGYQDQDQAWQYQKWWDFAGKGYGFLERNGVTLAASSGTLYYYAEATDGSGVTWQGDRTFDFEGASLAAQETVLTADSAGDYVISVSCEPPRGNLYFQNNCARPVRLAVGYQDKAQNWQYVKWWDFAANSQSYLQQGDVQLSSDNGTLYYYAEATDGSGITWQGDRPFDFGGESLSTREAVLTPDRDGDYVISVTCE